LKRPLSSVYEGKSRFQYSASSSKRVAKSSSYHTSQKAEWDIAGQYKIISVNQDVDTSGFSLKIFHFNNGVDHHLYATFIFDKLEGIMRMAPREGRPLGRFHLDEFEKACELEQALEPVPRNESWIMRWRAKDGGMRLGELVDDGLNNSFMVSMDEGSSRKEYIGVEVVFDIDYNNRVFNFKAMKTGNLETEAAVPPQVLVSKWKSLRKCAQAHSSDDDESSEEDRDLISLSDQLKRLKAMIKAQITPPLEESSVVSAGGLMRTMTKQVEQSIPKAPPALVANGRGGMRRVIEVLPHWAWDVAGEWKVELPQLAPALGFDKKKPWTMHFQVSNNPLHTRVGRQLWARLSFGDLRGYMRFCPMLGNLRDGPETVKKFEEACVLPTGCWPGPAPDGQQKWLLRWRGEGTYYGTEEGSDQQQNECIFEKAKDGSLTFSAVMFYDEQPFLLKAKQVEEAPLEKGNAVTITTCWNSSRPVDLSRGRRYIVPASSYQPYLD
jgi:hypothetical protein